MPASPSPRAPLHPGSAQRVEVIPVAGIPEIRPGDDLGAILARALGPGSADPARPGDVLCLSSKVVSKANGLVAHPADKARVLEEATVRVVARRLHGEVTTSIVEAVSGPVLAAAGIDASNSPGGILALPADPDAEAAAIGERLERELGFRVGVVLTDTSSRIWRIGVGDIALGSWGVHACEDLRGRIDDAGRPLGITVRALGDELAAAADLAKGKTSRSPGALVRGVAGAVRDASPGSSSGGEDARALNRTGSDDWFRRPSLESVWQALGLRLEDEPVALMDVEPDEARFARALSVAHAGPGAEAGGDDSAERPLAVLAATDPGCREGADADRTPRRMLIRPAGASAAAMIAAGALAERLRTALRAEEIAAPLPPWSVQIAPVAPTARAVRDETPSAGAPAAAALPGGRSSAAEPTSSHPQEEKP